jgi:hypothetical protein
MDFLNTTYEAFLEKASSRKCIIWGNSYLIPSIVKTIKDRCELAYIVDANFWLWGKEVCGLIVYSPTKLLKEERDKFVVLIASQDIFGIAAELEDMKIYQYYAFHFFNEEHLNHNYHVFGHITLNPIQ